MNSNGYGFWSDTLRIRLDSTGKVVVHLHPANCLKINGEDPQ